jgi:putative membrane protein
MRQATVVAVFAVAYGAVACSSAPSQGPRGELHSEAAAQPAVAPTLTDAEIAAIVVAANAIDAELGELAGSRGTSAPVQEFGRTMSRDHRAVNEGAVALVTRLGVKPVESDVSRQLRADAAAFRARLEKLSGAEFDNAYIEREVAYHKAVIDAVDTLLIPNAKNDELRRALTDVRPALVAHLQHAQHLQSTLEQAQ